jgi:hypothetical protein
MRKANPNIRMPSDIGRDNRYKLKILPART